jgi:tetratricopeptide (TPR) repeat protein
MQNTANLWQILCHDLEERQVKDSAEDHSAAARRFEDAAKHVFQKHPSRLRDALEIAGDIHQASGANDEAARCFAEAAEVQGMATPQEARLATKLAILSEKLGKLEDARKWYTAAIKAHDRQKDHAELPTLLNNLAALHRACGDFPAAEKAYIRALSEAVAMRGADDPEVALIADNLGVAYADHGDFAKAEDQHLRALQIREKNYGSRNPDVGQSLANLAMVYHARGLSTKAERFYHSALETLSYFYPPGEPRLERIRESYENLPQVRARRLSKTMRL